MSYSHHNSSANASAVDTTVAALPTKALEVECEKYATSRCDRHARRSSFYIVANSEGTLRFINHVNVA